MNPVPIEIWTPTYARMQLTRLNRENNSKRISKKKKLANQELINEIERKLENGEFK